MKFAAWLQKIFCNRPKRLSIMRENPQKIQDTRSLMDRKNSRIHGGNAQDIIFKYYNPQRLNTEA